MDKLQKRMDNNIIVTKRSNTNDSMKLLYQIKLFESIHNIVELSYSEKDMEMIGIHFFLLGFALSAPEYYIPIAWEFD